MPEVPGPEFEWTNTVDDINGNLFPRFTRSESGFIGGGQIGCNYQTGPWVFGIEGTFAGTSIKGERTFTLVNLDPTFTTKLDSVATVTGRLGYAWDNWLLYGKGGYAGADVKFSVSDPNIFGFGSESDWQSGWTAGVGVEYGLTPNWILGIEYDYIGLETRTHELGHGLGFFTFEGKPRINEVVGRISYKFW